MKTVISKSLKRKLKDSMYREYTVNRLENLVEFLKFSVAVEVAKYYAHKKSNKRSS